MQLQALLVGLLATTSSAYTISLYSSNDYQGTQRSYTTGGTHKPGFTVKSWIWTSGGDGCCIAFCKGTTNVGRYCGSARNAASTAGVNKVVTGCGSTVLNC